MSDLLFAMISMGTFERFPENGNMESIKPQDISEIKDVNRSNSMEKKVKDHVHIDYVVIQVSSIS